MSAENGQGLPPGWAEAELESIVDVLDGIRVPVNAKERSRRTGTIPYYGATGQVGWIDDFLFDETLVLLGEDGAPFFDKERRVAYLVKGKSWVNNHAHVLRAAVGIDASLVSHQLNVVDYHAFVSGTTRWKLNQAPMRKIPLKIPPAAEQSRIADTVDELFSDLDAGMAALERVREKLKLYRASVLKAAVEGALTAEWRAQHPHAEPATELLERVLTERRRRWEEDQVAKFKAKGQEPAKNWKAKYKEPVTPDTTNLPLLPEGWCWASFDQIGDTQGGLQKSPARAPRKNHYPYLRVANVLRGSLDLSNLHRFELSDDELQRLRLQAGDILIVEGNGSRTEIGRCALWRGDVADCVHQNHIIRVRPLHGVSSKFVDTFLNSPTGQNAIQQVASSTSGLYTLSISKIERLPVALAPTVEQEAIVEAVEDQLSVIDHLEADLDAKLRNAQSLRQAILRQAFTGQLVPQDPNDEPASELLKRIAAERQQRAVPNRRRRAASRRSVPPAARSPVTPSST